MKWSEHKGARLGRVCKRNHNHGGGSYRTANGSCVECALIQSRVYRRNNIQRYRDHANNWRSKNKIASLVHNVRSMRGATITVDDLKPFPKRCPLLGTMLQYDGKNKDAARRPSIDRINSAKGYIPGNVHIVSMRANQIKNNATHEELAMIAKNLEKIVSARRAAEKP